MSKYEQKDNSGALFKLADKDRKSDAAPQYRGECVVNGKELTVSAWIKTSAKGTKYMSLSFSEPFKKSVKVAGDDDTRSRGSHNFDDSESIPF